MILSVRVRNANYDRQHLFAYRIPEYTVYTGELVKRRSWMSPDEFRLSTGDRVYPYRVIHMDNVIDGVLHQ